MDIGIFGIGWQVFVVFLDSLLITFFRPHIPFSGQGLLPSFFAAIVSGGLRPAYPPLVKNCCCVRLSWRCARIKFIQLANLNHAKSEIIHHGRSVIFDGRAGGVSAR